MLAGIPAGAFAQATRQGAAAGDTEAGARVDPRSPRAAVEDFLTQTRHGQFAAAARYMGPEPPARAAELSRRLKEVLDQNLAIELEFVSPLATGDTADGLPNGRNARDQLGVIRTTGPVCCNRCNSSACRPGSDPAWVFAPRTVARIDHWYDALGDHWLRDRMPGALRQPGPFGIDRWQWVMLVFLLVPAIAVGWVAEQVTIAIAHHAVRRTTTTLDDDSSSTDAGHCCALGRDRLPRAGGVRRLSLAAEDIVGLVVRASSVAIITWFLVRATHVFEDELPRSPLGDNAPQVRAFAPLLGRVARIFLVAIGAIAIVSQFGYSVTAFLTGVGIGGIALAFAAQKTLENPFGSVAIGLDQPIRIGDWVKVGDVEGEVEAIGLRSTRIRTMERTIVVYPNGRLAERRWRITGSATGSSSAPGLR